MSVLKKNETETRDRAIQGGGGDDLKVKQDKEEDKGRQAALMQCCFPGTTKKGVQAAGGLRVSECNLTLHPN